MALELEVTFTDGHVFFPVGHLSRISAALGGTVDGTFDGSLTTSAIQDADPAATPPEIRTLSGETLFVSARQHDELERFCRASQIPIRRRFDIWGDLLEPFLDTEFTPEREAVTQRRLHQAGLTDTEIDQIRANVRPLMVAYNAFYWDWSHLGLADLLDAVTTSLDPPAGFYEWAMRIENRAGRQESGR